MSFIPAEKWYLVTKKMNKCFKSRLLEDFKVQSSKLSGMPKLGPISQQSFPVAVPGLQHSSNPSRDLSVFVHSLLTLAWCVKTAQAENHLKMPLYILSLIFKVAH